MIESLYQKDSDIFREFNKVKSCSARLVLHKKNDSL